MLRLFPTLSPTCLLQTIFLHLVRIPVCVNHVTFPSIVTFLFIVTYRRGPLHPYLGLGLIMLTLLSPYLRYHV